MKSDFKLRCCVKIDTSDVCVFTSVLSREGCFVSGSADSTVRFWVPKTDGAGFDEQNRVATAHPVSALCVLAPSDSKNLGLIAAASRTDHIVRFYRLDETSPLYQLEGHTDTVNAIVAGKFSLVTASSDHTARLWVKDKCVKILQEHEGVVWSVAVLTERAYTFTASEDKTIRMWKAGKCERVFRGHTAGVRCVIVLNIAEIATCGDDRTVRWWNVSDGTCTHTTDTQMKPVVSLALFPDSSSQFISCTTDNMLQVWRGQSLKQVIALPKPSLPAASCVLSSGDIVTCACDGTVYVFTSDFKRMASEADQQAFLRSVNTLKTDGLPVLEEPSADAARHEVSSNVTSKHLYQGKEYDFVFDVELYKGRPALKLPYNAGDDPRSAARSFLRLNDVDERYLDTVSNYIRSQTARCSQQPASPAAAAVPGSDMVTGAVSKTRAPVSKNPYFPETTFLSYTQRNLQQIFEKIQEFNKSVVQRGGREFSSENISLVERLVRHSRCFPAATDVLWQMLHWPPAFLFPVLDVLRLVVLQSAGCEHFIQTDQFIEFACRQLGCQSHPKNQLVMLRVLCNMFQHPDGERFVVKHSEKLLSVAMSELCNSAEKHIQLTLSTFVLNLTIASRSANDLIGVRRCLEAAALLTETQSDTEAHFRLLVSIGSALSRRHGDYDDDDVDVGDEIDRQSLDLQNFLHLCQVDGTDKTRHCAQLLTDLLPQ